MSAVGFRVVQTDAMPRDAVLVVPVPDPPESTPGDPLARGLFAIAVVARRSFVVRNGVTPAAEKGESAEGAG